MMSTFLQLLRIANTTRDKQWDPAGKFDLSFFGNELGGESGEAQNVIKKLERERLGAVGSRSTPQALAEELADVIIVCDLIALRFNIDLEDAIRHKFNATSAKNGFDVWL
jgi:NTP pyrophosphatase (non-canonical NTP hydrolase)